MTDDDPPVDRAAAVRDGGTHRQRSYPPMKMLPSASVCVGRIVAPMVTCKPFVVAVTANGTPSVGRLPSPRSSVPVPENVTLPSRLLRPLLTLPTRVMSCAWPSSDVPARTISKFPTADPSALTTTPKPNVEPWSGTPLKGAPGGKGTEGAAGTPGFEAAIARCTQ